VTTRAFRLDGKRAAVTGGASGIGEAIGRTFGAQGAEVHILDLNQGAGEKVVQEIREAEGSAFFHPCDVTDGGSVRSAFAEIQDQGPLHILVNNAGIAHVGNLEGTSEEDFHRVFSVNVKGVYLCMHAAIGPMREAGGGVIVNMASVAASVGISDRFAYSMSKGAVLAMTYSAAKDYATQGIRVVSISPARIHTPFVDGFLKASYPGREEEMFAKLAATQPIGRMGTPREVADLALYLCSDAASFATGTDYPIDGGFLRLNN